MKRNLLLLLITSFAIAAYGQSSIQNGSFENWTSSTADYPQNYPNTSNSQAFYRYHLPFNVTKSTDAYHGTYAVQLTTNASTTDTVFGYFVNINPNAGPSSWVGGMPYDQIPTGIRGWYKYNVETADSGTVIVSFSKGGSNIGIYFFSIGGIHTNYTPFDLTFSPALTMAPDSVAIGFLSCKFLISQGQPHGPAGSTLIVDSVSFTGVASQPAMMNGDFESWGSQEFTSPDNWYVQSDNGQGFAKTDDAEKGNYALELTTYLGNQDNKVAAQAGRISTGYYPSNCNNDCHELGGFPYSNQSDTLVFYYKYAPAHPEDSTSIVLNFKKDGTQIWGGSIYVHAAAQYTLMKYPFNLGQAPDSVIVDIQSSDYQDTALDYVGADLKIDNIYFQSQALPSGINNHVNDFSVKILPNPTTGLVHIMGINKPIQSVEVYNIYGQKVFVLSGLKQQIPDVIDLSGQLKGIYFMKISSGNISHTEKIVLQ